jgi:hypothetical protein
MERNIILGSVTFNVDWRCKEDIVVKFKGETIQPLRSNNLVVITVPITGNKENPDELVINNVYSVLLYKEELEQGGIVNLLVCFEFV